MEALTELVGKAGEYVWYVVFAILIGVGLYLTIRTKAIQLRGIPEMFRVLTDPAGEEDGKKGISSFRAFTVSAAARVGTGNIAGVAIAISLSGPGPPARAGRCRKADDS